MKKLHSLGSRFFSPLSIYLNETINWSISFMVSPIRTLIYISAIQVMQVHSVTLLMWCFGTTQCTCSVQTKAGGWRGKCYKSVQQCRNKDLLNESHVNVDHRLWVTVGRERVEGVWEGGRCSELMTSLPVLNKPSPTSNAQYNCNSTTGYSENVIFGLS